LIDIYNSLVVVNNEQDEIVLQFNAHLLPNRGNDYIAKDVSGQPVILISINCAKTDVELSSIDLEHININHGNKCVVKGENRIIYEGIFTIIRLKNADVRLQEYFFRVIIPIIDGLPILPIYQDVSRAVTTVAELFRNISFPSRKTIQGLWGELFIIARSKSPELLIESWHSNPDNIYDFSYDNQRIEIKTTSRDTRTHYFSYDQLNPPNNIGALIVSMQVIRSINGYSVNDLVDKIRKVINQDQDRIQRLNYIIGATIGSNWRLLEDVKYSTEAAEKSILYYRHSDIPTVSSPIPIGVSEVHFKADLSFCKSIKATTIDVNNYLIGALLIHGKNSCQELDDC
jgi:hypothetical protein